jgi:hypothetical protein
MANNSTRYSKLGRETAQTYPATKSTGTGAGHLTCPTSFPMRLRQWTQSDNSGDGDRDIFDKQSKGSGFNPKRGPTRPHPEGVEAIKGKGSVEEHLACRFEVDTVANQHETTAHARMDNQYKKLGISDPARSQHVDCSCSGCRANGFDATHPSNVRYADKFNVTS